MLDHYRVTLFRQGPGMAFPSGRVRFFSAHLDTVTRSAGRRTWSALYIQLGIV